MLYGWATGPVDAVADDLKTAFTTMTAGCEDDGLSGAQSSTSVAAALVEVTGSDGAWGMDERFIRGRVYDFATALTGCGKDYETSDKANAAGLSGWFDTEYGDGREPGELGDSQPYQD